MGRQTGVVRAGRVAGLQRRLVHRLDGGMELCRQDQQFSPGLDDDPPDVPARCRDDVEGLTFCGEANLVTKACQLVGLVEPSLTALFVLVEKVRDTRGKL